MLVFVCWQFVSCIVPVYNVIMTDNVMLLYTYLHFTVQNAWSVLIYGHRK